MSENEHELTGPDFGAGILISDIPDGGMLGGHSSGQAVLISRTDDEVHAIGSACTHYGGPLAEGLRVGNTVRCPWHHACFDLRTGEAIRAPALKPVATWEVVRSGDTVRVIRENPVSDGASAPAGTVVTFPDVKSIVIVGAGAAGNAAAEMLRRRGYAGSVTLIGADESVPYDRPNLSKDYLAGNAPEDWIPLRTAEFYEEHEIDLVRGVRVESIDAAKRVVNLSDGTDRHFDRILIATGAEPIRLSIPGSDLPHVHYLRTLDDSRAIIEGAGNATRIAVIGASFIGLEVAAALRARDLEVHVIAPETLPLEKILGSDLGTFVQNLHEQNGVRFHLDQSVSAITAGTVELDNGAVIDVDMVVVGIGVRPATGLAESAGIKADKGILANEYMETSVPGIFAAGDIARYPDLVTGDRVRVEHWVVAERQGQVAAQNMIGMNVRFDSAPFFWSNHYGASILYVGHAEGWDEIVTSGKPSSGDGIVAYRKGGRTLAVATLGRAIESLEAENALERGDFEALDVLMIKRN